jgi:hypothetical protein
MDAVLTYRGRVVIEADVAFIRELIAAHPQDSRRALSKKLCEAWGWKQENGQLKDMVCRSLLLELHRGGQIELPPRRMRPPNNVASRVRPGPVDLDRRPICGTLTDLGPLDLRQVRRAGDEERLFNGLLAAHHYLGYAQPVGEHLKFVVYAGERPVACFAWSSSSPRLLPRDRYIGWSPQAKQRNIQLLAYNSRFLILPWVEVRHLASHVLALMTRALSDHWERVYGHPIYFAETYVDRERFRGTCYRAANWVHLGQTTGRGKDSPTWRATRSKKDVYGLALTKRFRELLGRES